MADNILDSYLVKLGASVDMPSISKFSAITKEMGLITKNVYVEMAVKAVEFQIAVTTALASVAAAAIKMADSIAQSDQDYRLFALHMFMGQKPAKELKIAMDALGESIDNITWDPELRKRFEELWNLQERMSVSIGPDFEKNMKSIRDIRFEFTKFKVEMQYIAMGTVSSIFEKMGFGSGDFLKRLEQINDWIVSKAPKIIEFISSNLAPALLDIKDVLVDTFGLFKDFGTLFTNFIGLLSGDKSLEGAEFKFSKFARAIGEVVHAFASLLEYMILIEKVLVHLSDSLVLLAGGKWAAAASELKAGISDMFSTAGMAGDAAIGVGSRFFGAVPGYNPPAGHAASGFLGNLSQHLFGNNKDAAGVQDMQSRQDIDKYINMAASIRSYAGVTADLLRNVITAESGGNPNVGDTYDAATHTPHMGLMQISPDIAKKYGAQNPHDPKQNIYAGANYIADLMKRFHGDVAKTMAWYGGGSQWENALSTGQVSAREQDYLAKTAGTYIASAPAAPASHDFNVGDVNIEVHGTDLKPDDVGKAVTDHLRRYHEMEVQRGSAQFTSPYALATP